MHARRPATSGFYLKVGKLELSGLRAISYDHDQLSCAVRSPYQPRNQSCRQYQPLREVLGLQLGEAHQIEVMVHDVCKCMSWTIIQNSMQQTNIY
jgi:hypothetical protein